MVSEKKRKELKKKLKSLGISKKDIKENFIKSSGNGGQKINKTNICVQIKYIPDNLIVKCDKSRSQNLNRFLALRTLVEKIEGKNNKAQIAIKKIKKQKRRRKKRAVLKNKQYDEI